MSASHGFTFTPEEQVEKLVAMGVPRDAAERAAYGGSSVVTVKDAKVSIGGMSVDYMQVVGPRLDFPIRFNLPWSALISDNRKYAATVSRREAGGTFPRLTLHGDYRAAKSKAADRAREAMTIDGQRFPALARPLALHARVFVPDNRVHDVFNFAKCCHDALEGVIYKTDSWLHRVTWENAGVDVDSPRAELTIEPL